MSVQPVLVSALFRAVNVKTVFVVVRARYELVGGLQRFQAVKTEAARIPIQLVPRPVLKWGRVADNWHVLNKLKPRLRIACGKKAFSMSGLPNFQISSLQQLLVKVHT